MTLPKWHLTAHPFQPFLYKICTWYYIVSITMVMLIIIPLLITLGTTTSYKHSLHVHAYTHAEFMLDDHHNKTKSISYSTYCLEVNLNSGGDLYNTSSYTYQLYMLLICHKALSMYIHTAYNAFPIVQYYMYIAMNSQLLLYSYFAS